MKRILLSLFLTAAFILNAKAMGYEEARQRAWFLTDKMAYELNLSPAQYDRAYEINLEYLMSIRTASDCGGYYWQYRDADLRCVLFDWQYTLYRTIDYFFRPVRWVRSAWYYPVCRHYHHDYYYFERPSVYRSYRGGHWHNRRYYDRSPYHGMHFSHGRGMRDHYKKPYRPGKHYGNGRPGGHRPDKDKHDGFRPGKDHNNRPGNGRPGGHRPDKDKDNGFQPGKDNNNRPGNNHGNRPGNGSNLRPGSNTKPATAKPAFRPGSNKDFQRPAGSGHVQWNGNKNNTTDKTLGNRPTSGRDFRSNRPSEERSNNSRGNVNNSRPAQRQTARPSSQRAGNTSKSSRSGNNSRSSNRGNSRSFGGR